MAPNDACQLLYGLLPHLPGLFYVTIEYCKSDVMPPSEMVIQDLAVYILLTLFSSDYTCTGDSQMPCLEDIQASPARKPMWQGTEGISQHSCIIQAILGSWPSNPH